MRAERHHPRRQADSRTSSQTDSTSPEPPRSRQPSATARPRSRRRISARLRLALSYSFFLVAAGFAILFGIYLVLRYVPNYPLTAANPSDTGFIATRSEILGALVGMSGVILILLALVGLGGGWLLAGWILRPLQQINTAAHIAATGRLDHRIRLTGRNDEFRQLADSFDVMLGRLHDAFATQERFAANASHELRTPLAVTATLLDVARDNPESQDYPTLLERLSITNSRAIGLTEALLRLSDVSATTAAFEPVDLAEVVESVVTENLPEAELKRVTIAASLQRAPVDGDPELLRQLAANLVQNSIRHNRELGVVSVSVARDAAGSAVLRIENDGEIYLPAVVAELSEPFLRSAGRVTERGRPSGYGLGLALVTRIVDVHGGGFSIAARPHGGLTVEVTLPAGGWAERALAPSSTG